MYYSIENRSPFLDSDLFDLAYSIPSHLLIKDGKATKAHITTGKSFNNQTEVLKGLELNTLVANKGYRELAEGVVVRVKDENTDSATKLAAQ